MGNALRVFKRDILRLFKTPAALVVALALVVLPSLYSWFNVVGFWDPYGNTNHLRVCVVNEDAGASDEAFGTMNVGEQVIDQLHENEQLGWAFTDYDQAMEEVRSGRAYAAFVIPESFTADLMTILTDDFRRPSIQYYVNEKANPVSPKITDVGSETLDETINSQFVATASQVVASVLDEKLADAGHALDEAESGATAQLASAEDAVSHARELLSDLAAATSDAQGKAEGAKRSLQTARDDAAAIEEQLQHVTDVADSLQGSLLLFTSTVSPALGDASTALSEVLLGVSAGVGDAAAGVSAAQGDVEATLGSARAALEANAAAIAQLQAVVDGMPEGAPGKAELQAVVGELSSANDDLRQGVADLERVSADTSAAADAVADAASGTAEAVQGASDASSAYQSQLFGDLLPRMTTGVSHVGSAAQNLKGAIANQDYLIDETAAVLDQLASSLSVASDAFGKTDAPLAELQDGIASARTDALALGASGALADVLDPSRIDPSKLADFMASPAQVTTEKLYPLNAYGSAMAPLFMNLSLWVGTVMLCVILRLGVDREGVPGLTVKQGFVGRWLLFALLAALQAVVCCTGCLALGVQCVSVPAFYLAAIVMSLAYLTIVYSLSALFQHIGIGICIALVFIQIPGATGLYPIEMTPAFFQAVYPLFPFTYGINALRETIGGFYGDTFASCLGMLLLCLIVTGAVALFARPYVTNLNRLVAKEVERSDLLNGERPEVPSRRYRLGQLARALADHEEFHVAMQRQAERFLRWYGRAKRGVLVAGIAVPVVLAAVFALVNGEKVLLLTAWLVWFACVVVALLALELVRNGLEHKGALDAMSADELQGLLSASSVAVPAPDFASAAPAPSDSRAVLSEKVHGAPASKETCGDEARDAETKGDARGVGAHADDEGEGGRDA